MKAAEKLMLLVLLWSSTAATRADYVLALGSQGAPLQFVTRGQSFELAVGLTSDRNDRNNAAILRLEFDAPGLVLQSYQWFPPYGTADGNDDSRPQAAELPKALNTETLSGPGYPPETIDLELSNVTGVSPGFSSGQLAKLVMTVPADFAGPNVIRIRPIPDTLATGFEVIPVRVTGDFYLVLVAPGPPRLEVRVSKNTVVLFWSSTLQGYEPEQSQNLTDPAGWKPLHQPVFTVGDRTAVIMPVSPSGLFFRLRRP